ncbi:ras-related protein Rab-33B isoform X2 [Vulpes vulpes]|uniref:Ras-related protein Rab-33B isoform X2 n=1 Tax=Vulpes vulpes TaxID=9627 RepID=A0ABM5A947_VULVU
MESSLEASLSSSGAVSGAAGFLPPARSRIFKIIVIGDSNVGKTCLTYRFCAGRFPDRTEATIGVDFRERAVEIDGERIKLGKGAAAVGAVAGGRVRARWQRLRRREAANQGRRRSLEVLRRETYPVVGHSRTRTI